MQAKNVKRQMTAQGRAALELRNGSRARPVDSRRPKGGRSGARRAAVQEG